MCSQWSSAGTMSGQAGTEAKPRAHAGAVIRNGIGIHNPKWIEMMFCVRNWTGVGGSLLHRGLGLGLNGEPAGICSLLGRLKAGCFAI